MNTSQPERTAVVVGIDIGEGSALALAYATHTALLRRRPLEIVHFWDTPEEEQPARAAVGAATSHAERIVRGAVPVTGRSLPGSPVSGLVEASVRAELLVVGHGGRDAPADAASAADAVARQAQAPVVLVPPVWAAPSQRRCVTVAVRDPGHCAQLVEEAFRAAAVERAELTALHVWHPDSLEQAALARIGGPEWYPLEEGERGQRLEKCLADAAERFPGIRHTVDLEPALAPAAKVLAEASEWSVLVVVGRDDPVTSGEPGPVVADLARRALCPVLVVPHPPSVDAVEALAGEGRASVEPR